MRTILILLMVAACDLTTHGERGAPDHSPNILGACCVPGSVCVQPRMEQPTCDPGMIECLGEAAPLSEYGPLWECRESSPVTARIVTGAAGQSYSTAILHGMIAAQGL